MRSARDEIVRRQGDGFVHDLLTTVDGESIRLLRMQVTAMLRDEACCQNIEREAAASAGWRIRPGGDE